MQKKKWVRVGLAAAIVGGAVGGMSAAGCSGDDNTVGPGNDGGKNDSSIPSGDSGTDTGQPSEGGGGGDADAAPPVKFAKVYLVHAAADPLAQPLRFCFGIVAGTGDAGTISTAPFAPLPDTRLSPSFPIAGFFPGFGAALTSAPQVADIDLSTVSLAIFAIDATKIANNTADGGPDGGTELECSSFIGTSGAGGSLTLNTDYWNIGTIPAQTLNHGQTWVVAVTGCFPGEDGNEADFCPTSPPYGANGNLGVKAWQLDNTTAVALDGGIGAQFASASPSWDTLNAQAGGVTTAAGFWIETPPVIPDSGTPDTGAGEAGDAATDGSSDAAVEATTDSGAPPEPTLTLIPITGTGTYGTISPTNLVTVPVPLNVQTAGFFTSFVGADAGAITFPPGCTPGVTCASPFLYPLPVIDQVTNGTVPTGGSFAYGKGYAFILVGDPLDPTYINPVDGGAATSTTGVFNGKSAHFLGLPTANP